eukprot:113095-Rhodomonas_salina.1
MTQSDTEASLSGPPFGTNPTAFAMHVSAGHCIAKLMKARTTSVQRIAGALRYKGGAVERRRVCKGGRCIKAEAGTSIDIERLRDLLRTTIRYVSTGHRIAHILRQYAASAYRDKLRHYWKVPRTGVGRVGQLRAVSTGLCVARARRRVAELTWPHVSVSNSPLSPKPFESTGSIMPKSVPSSP